MSVSNSDIFSKLKGKVLFNEPLSKHTWLGVGGPAEVLFSPFDLEDLCFFLKNKPDNMPVHILGGGSNLLVRDGGIDGVVIKFDAPYFKQIMQKKDCVCCFCGVKNVLLKEFFISNQIGGLEFLCSIPGTIGGLVRTNAGCFGKSLSDVLISAVVMDFDGNIKEVSNADFRFSYRSSNFPKDWIIVSLCLKIEKSTAMQIKEIIEEHQNYRKEHQPYNERTAGSTFKNPEGLSAWRLIKESGCDKLQIGGAKMSEKHCNFMINTGSATADDCEKLGDLIVKKVKEKTGVELVWEIQKIGRKK